jgi:CxxC motif-containing protein (DUF1111 family)
LELYQPTAKWTEDKVDVVGYGFVEKVPQLNLTKRLAMQMIAQELVEPIQLESTVTEEDPLKKTGEAIIPNGSTPITEDKGDGVKKTSPPRSKPTAEDASVKPT